MNTFIIILVILIIIAIGLVFLLKKKENKCQKGFEMVDGNCKPLKFDECREKLAAYQKFQEAGGKAPEKGWCIANLKQCAENFCKNEIKAKDVNECVKEFVDYNQIAKVPICPTSCKSEEEYLDHDYKCQLSRPLVFKDCAILRKDSKYCAPHLEQCAEDVCKKLDSRNLKECVQSFKNVQRIYNIADCGPCPKEFIEKKDFHCDPIKDHVDSCIVDIGGKKCVPDLDNCAEDICKNKIHAMNPESCKKKFKDYWKEHNLPPNCPTKCQPNFYLDKKYKCEPVSPHFDTCLKDRGDGQPCAPDLNNCALNLCDKKLDALYPKECVQAFEDYNKNVKHSPSCDDQCKLGYVLNNADKCLPIKSYFTTCTKNRGDNVNCIPNLPDCSKNICEKDLKAPNIQSCVGAFTNYENQVAKAPKCTDKCAPGYILDNNQKCESIKGVLESCKYDK